MKSAEHQNIVYLLKLLIIIFITVAAMAVIFATGVWVGQQQAQFSFAWAENYHKNFGGSNFTNSHGVFGTVVSIRENTVIVIGEDGKEKTVLVSEATSFVDSDGVSAFESLRMGDTVVVIGSPNVEGQIEAKFIRVLPRETL